MRNVTVICRPGTILGPCKERCKHVACRSAKKVARAKCPLCGEPIGYLTGVSELHARSEDRRVWCHSGCLEGKIKDRRDEAAALGRALKRIAATGDASIKDAADKLADFLK